ncbi:hypothetical protein K8I61_00095 [bacterium]|nr:hypothetical protein [bacterium]
MNGDDGAAAKVLCRRCRHYRVTWDKNAPHGCAALDFKSRRLPCVAVYESSGRPCLSFAPREPNDAGDHKRRA